MTAKGARNQEDREPIPLRDARPNRPDNAPQTRHQNDEPTKNERAWSAKDEPKTADDDEENEDAATDYCCDEKPGLQVRELRITRAKTATTSTTKKATKTVSIA